MKLKITFLFNLLVFVNISSFSKTSDYTTEDVTFNNEVDSIILAGTLTKPKNNTDFPTVILISGSGPQNRNSELMGHKPFLTIAKYLSSIGIAVLRIDDRGVGESTGEHDIAQLSNFVEDTKSAYAFLNTRSDINTKKIGLIGHSLGGVIAPIVASETKALNFIVLLAGTGMRGDKLMLLQKEMIERKMGVPEIGITTGQKNIAGAYEIILNHSGNQADLEKELTTYFSPIFGKTLSEKQIQTLSVQIATPWLTDFIKFDPKDALSKVNCPVLALNGSMDLQVPPSNLNLIKDAVLSGGNVDITTIEFPKHNHLFQKCKTGLPAEYGLLEESFSPKVLKTMSKWILKNCK